VRRRIYGSRVCGPRTTLSGDRRTACTAARTLCVVSPAVLADKLRAYVLSGTILTSSVRLHSCVPACLLSCVPGLGLDALPGLCAVRPRADANNDGLLSVDEIELLLERLKLVRPASALIAPLEGRTLNPIQSPLRAGMPWASLGPTQQSPGWALILPLEYSCRTAAPVVVRRAVRSRLHVGEW
jgi:hypothetical protein